jgi:formyl-CoA transferase
MPELRSDARFAARDVRMRNRHELKRVVEEVLRTKTVDEWVQRFNKAAVPAGPILGVAGIANHAHVESRQLLRRFPAAAGIGKDIAVPKLGFRLSREQPDVDRPPPQLGQDTNDVLSSAGYSEEEISALRSNGVI